MSSNIFTQFFFVFCIYNAATKIKKSTGLRHTVDLNTSLFLIRALFSHTQGKREIAQPKDKANDSPFHRWECRVLWKCRIHANARARASFFWHERELLWPREELLRSRPRAYTYKIASNKTSGILQQQQRYESAGAKRDWRVAAVSWEKVSRPIDNQLIFKYSFFRANARAAFCLLFFLSLSRFA